MPQMYNGCGTWYYGKRNRETYQGICRACGAATTLASYDTRLYVVVLLIPIFPLGRRRIIEQCPGCSRHLALPLKEWQVAQERAQTIITQYGGSRGNAELAEECLRVCLSYRNQKAFVPLAEEMAVDFANDPRMLQLLASGYESFGRLQESEKLLRRAWTVEDTAETREALANRLLSLDRPEEAAPLLAHIAAEGIPDRVDLLYSLAQQWQMKGEHERALTVLDQCEALVPQIVEDKTFEALREASRQHLGTGKKVKPSQIVSKLKRASALRSTARIAPIALALAVGAYCVVAWIWGHYPKVFLVNGVDQPYQIKLAGKLYTLAPNSFAKASIAEGDAPLEVVDLPAAVPPEEISLHTSFLKRPFSSTVFVINPDRAAVLHQVRAYYGSSAPPPESKLFAGQTLHRFTGINCPFEKLPDSITTSHGGTESRVGLSLLSMQQKLSPHTKALLLGQVLGNDATVEALKRYLVFNPDAVEVLGALSRMVPAETLVEILRPRLADRPVRVDWHRMNQDTLSKLARDEECERQYNELLVASPDDPDLIYLAARASSDPTRSAEMCNKLIASGAASGRAHTWLCHYHLCGGRFREAIEHGAEAAKLLPDHAPTRANYVSALLADHQFEQALEASEPGTHLTYPDCVHWFREELYALEALGRHEEAERVVERLRRAMNMVENAEQMIRYVLADSDYARGDIPGYLQRMNAVRTSNSELSAAITSGSFDDAEKALADDGPSAESELLVYLAARLKGNHAVAERHLASAIQLLAKEDRDARVFATALEGDAAACETALDRAILPHEQKAIYLAALATVAGDARQRCLAMAEQLNTDLRFPHLLIKQTIESLKEPSGHDGPG